MNEAILILPNMRGGCATVGNTVHTLFRITSRSPRPMAGPIRQQALPALHTTEVETAKHKSPDQRRADYSFSNL